MCSVRTVIIESVLSKEYSHSLIVESFEQDAMWLFGKLQIWFILSLWARSLVISCVYVLVEQFIIHIEIEPSNEPEANFASESLVKQLIWSLWSFWILKRIETVFGNMLGKWDEVLKREALYIGMSFCLFIHQKKST